MKHHDIVKLCAASLRTFLNDKHGIKLKSGHAHEIVAAFLGYKSAISLRQDMQCPISNLDQAEYIVFDTPTLLVEQRIKDLEGLPADFPPSYILAEAIYSVLVAQEGMVEKLWPTFRDLAIYLAEQPIHEKLRMLGIKPDSLQWLIDVKGGTTEDGLRMAVAFDQPIEGGKRSSYANVDITLSCMAGRIGYGRADILPTFYSGQMRDPDFRLKLGIS